MAVVLCFDDAFGQPRQETVVVDPSPAHQHRRKQPQHDDDDEDHGDEDDDDKTTEQSIVHGSTNNNKSNCSKRILRPSSSTSSIADATEHILQQSACAHNKNSIHSAPASPVMSRSPSTRNFVAHMRQHSCSATGNTHMRQHNSGRLLVRELSVSDSHLQDEDVQAICEVLLSSSASSNNSKTQPRKSSINNKKLLISTPTPNIPNINNRRRKRSLLKKSSSSLSVNNEKDDVKSQSSPAATAPPQELSACVCCGLERLKLTNNGLTCTASLALIVTHTSETLQELDLSNNQLKAPDLEKLVEALTSSSNIMTTTTSTTSSSCIGTAAGAGSGPHPSTTSLSSSTTTCRLQKLNLFNNRLGSPAAETIAHLLKYNTSITDLRLGRNSLKSRKCLKIIAAAVMQNEVLQHLDLSFNQISNANAMHLAPILDPNRSKCPLLSLDLKHNGITATGAKEIAGAMVEGPNILLEKLDLSTNNLGLEGTYAMAFVYKYSHSLQELILSGCNIGDAGLHLLCMGWQEQENGCVLRHLDVSWNLIHNDGAVELASCMLTGPDAIMERLNLASNGIADAGACALARALTTRGSTRPLRELNLIGNQIGDVGAIALANAICCTHDGDPELYQLQSLAWQENKHMTEEVGKLRIQQALRFRQHYATWLEEKYLIPIQETTRERRLNLRLFGKKDVLGDDELICICHYVSKYRCKVPILELQGPHMTERGIQALCDQVISGATGIDDGNSLDGQGSFRKSGVLERLYMRNVPGCGDAGACLYAQAVQQPSCSLAVLSLVNCNISCQGATELAHALSPVGKSSPLRRVDLKGNSIGDVGAIELLTAVRFLPAAPKAVGRDGQPSEDARSDGVCNATALNLSCNKISDASLSLTASIIATLTTTNACRLEELDISDNLITDRGALDLAKTCMDLEPLRWLTVSGNHMTERGVQVLNLYLPRACSLVAHGQQS